MLLEVAGALLVRGKLYRHGCAVRRACSRYAQNGETVLPDVLVQYPGIIVLCGYVEPLLSHVRRISLRSVSAVMIGPPIFFNRVGKAVFLYIVAVTNVVVWWTKLKGIRSDTTLFRRVLNDFFEFHLKGKLRAQSEVLSSNKDFKR